MKSELGRLCRGYGHLRLHITLTLGLHWPLQSLWEGNPEKDTQLRQTKTKEVYMLGQLQ